MSTSEDTQVPELIINTLNKSQYNTLLQNNQIADDQLYLTTDENYYLAANVTYGTTTYAQITSMLTEHIEPVCYYNGYRYSYAGLDTYYYFTCVTNNSIKYVRVNSSDVWSNNSYFIQTTDTVYKPLVLTSAPTASTFGNIGDLCVNTDNSSVYICTSADTTNSSYTWRQISLI